MYYIPLALVHVGPDYLKVTIITAMSEFCSNIEAVISSFLIRTTIIL